MSSLFLSLLRFFFYLLIFVISIGFAHADGPLNTLDYEDKTKVRIGVLAFDEPVKNFARWQPTIDYLNEELPQHQFTLISGDIKSIEQLVANGTVDFVIANSVVYKQFQADYQSTQVLSLKPLSGDPSFAIGSAVIARKNVSNITSWSDLQNKRIIATMPEAFGGYQIMLKEWIEQGIDPDTYFKSFHFIGLPQKRLLDEVAEQKADIAILPTCVLEKAVQEGDFLEDDLQVLFIQNQSYLPCQSSTPLYPFWTLLRTQHVHEPLARDVAQKLLAIQATDSAAIHGQYQGWTIPINDHSILELMKTIHPDEEDTVSLLKLLWQRYKTWFFAILLLGVLSFAYHLHVKYLVRLRTSQLQKALAEKEESSQRLREQQEQFYSAQRILLSGELAAGLAHELNQPLMAINSYVVGCKMRLRQDPLDIEAFEQVLDSAVQQTVNAKDIIKRVRQFTKAKSPQQNHFLLNDVIANALALFEHEIQRRAIHVVVPAIPQLQVFADEVLIQQVIVNLISNAMDAIQSRQQKVRQGKISFSLELGDGYVTCKICDNGMGMTDEQKKHLFMPFITSKENGMGLGMITCQRIIHAHQGRIWVESTEFNDGSCIAFSLPLLQDI